MADRDPLGSRPGHPLRRGDRYGRDFTESVRFTVVEDEAAAKTESQKLLRKDGFDTQQKKEVRDPKGLDSEEAKSARND